MICRLWGSAFNNPWRKAADATAQSRPGDNDCSPSAMSSGCAVETIKEVLWLRSEYGRTTHCFSAAWLTRRICVRPHRAQLCIEAVARASIPFPSSQFLFWTLASVDFPVFFLLKVQALVPVWRMQLVLHICEAPSVGSTNLRWKVLKVTLVFLLNTDSPSHCWSLNNPVVIYRACTLYGNLGII